MIDQKKLETCPVCGGGVVAWCSKKRLNENFVVDRCKKCGFAFVNPRPSLEYLKKFYKEDVHHSKESDFSETPSVSLVLKKEEEYPNSTLDARRIITVLR